MGLGVRSVGRVNRIRMSCPASTNTDSRASTTRTPALSEVANRLASAPELIESEAPVSAPISGRLEVVSATEPTTSKALSGTSSMTLPSSSMTTGSSGMAAAPCLTGGTFLLYQSSVSSSTSEKTVASLTWPAASMTGSCAPSMAWFMAWAASFTAWVASVSCCVVTAPSWILSSRAGALPLSGSPMVPELDASAAAKAFA